MKKKIALFLFFIMVFSGVVHSIDKGYANEEKNAIEMSNSQAFDFSPEAILEAGIEDEILAQAIYESIQAQPNSFLNGQTLTSNTYTSVEELLNNFNGTINASNRGITNVRGMRMLKSCVAWDLSNNRILNLAPLSAMPLETSSWLEYTYAQQHYYGTRGKNLTINIQGNQIQVYPRWLEGRIDVQPTLTDNPIKLEKTSYVFVHEGTFAYSEEIAPDPHIYIFNDDVDRFIESDMNAHRINIDPYHTGVDVPAGATATGARVLEGFEGGQTSAINVNNIKRSGNFEIWFFPLSEGLIDDRFNFLTINDAYYDRVGRDTQHISWRMPVDVKFYNNVKIDTEQDGETEVENFETNHSITFAKTGRDDNELKAGAVYGLYKADGTPMGSYTTSAEQGENFGKFTVSHLEQGDYYLVEEKAPEGYLLDATPIEFTIEGEASISIEGGAGQKIITSDGENRVIQGMDGDASNEGNGTFMLGGEESEVPVRLKVHAPEGITLKSITLSWTEGVATSTDEWGYPIVIAGNEGSQTFEGSGAVAAAEAKIEECRGLHQNVIVSAKFEKNLGISGGDDIEPVPVKLSAKKVLKNQDGTLDFTDTLEANQFSFTLAAKEGTPALPEGYVTTVWNKADGSINFEEFMVGSDITVDTPKSEEGYYEYHYVITEGESQDSRYERDTESCEVTVKVGKDETTGALEVKDISYQKGGASSNVFVNKYKEFEAKFSLSASKVFKDSNDKAIALSDAEPFTFTIVPIDGTPAFAEGYDNEKSSNANGEIFFDEITVGSEITPDTETADGIYKYYYKITENKGDNERISYDESEYIVEVVVDKENPENPQITYTKNGSPAEPKFVNIYNLPESNEIAIKATKIIADENGTQLVDQDGKAIHPLDGAFEFVVYNAKNDEIERAENDETGTVIFDSLAIGEDLTYKMIEEDADGLFQYTYFIKEAENTYPDFIVDSSEYKVIVEASILDGQLVPMKVICYKDNTFVIEKAVSDDGRGVYDLKLEKEIKFSNTYVAPEPVKVQLEAVKTLADKNGKDLSEFLEKDQFSFKLSVDSEGTPALPEDYEDVVTNGADGKVTFAAFTVGAEITPATSVNENGYYEYHYEITEEESQDPRYDRDMATCKVMVEVEKDETTGVLEVKSISYQKGGASSNVFVNKYKDFEAKFSLSASKVFKDSNDKAIALSDAESFTFTIVPMDGTPAFAEGYDNEKSSNANGEIFFDEITVGSEITPNTETADGIYKYYYKITENKGDNERISYDESEYIVEVVVDKEDPENPQITYKKNGRSAEPQFVNVYNIPETKQIAIRANKTIVDENGNPLLDQNGNPINPLAGSFEFVVYDVEYNELSRARNNSAGIIGFDVVTIGKDLTYEKIAEDEDGIFQYTYFIEEAEINLPNFTKDPSKYKIVVDASIIDGKLVPVNVACFKDNEFLGEKAVADDVSGVCDLGMERRVKFTNAYVAPKPVEVQLEAIKKVVEKSGIDLSEYLVEGQFSFKLSVNSEGTPALPEGYEDVITNGADGKAKFAPLTLGGDITPATPVNEDGYYEYNYLITEVVGDYEYCEYDESQYEVTVLLEKVDGNLVTKSITYVKNEKVSKNGAVFVNEFENGKFPRNGERPIKPDSPITGDSNTIFAWAVLSVVSFVAISFIFKKVRR